MSIKSLCIITLLGLIMLIICAVIGLKWWGILIMGGVLGLAAGKIYLAFQKDSGEFT